MPNIKSASKRVQIAKERNERNKAAKTALKTVVKKFDAAVASGDREAATSAQVAAVKAVDRAASKNLIHKNNAANKKSSMAKKLSAM